MLNETQTQDMIKLLREFMFLKEIKSSTVQDLETRAVKSLQHEILSNDSLKKFNQGRVTAVDGESSLGILAVLQDMSKSPSLARLSPALNPSKGNQAMKERLSGYLNSKFPTPLVMAVLTQETNLKWYRKDGYPLVGLDYNSDEDYIITSRGLFYSQRTIFSYPISKKEFDSMNDLESDMEFFFDHIFGKYQNFVVSSSAKARDDLRYSVPEFKDLDLRGCKYEESDSKYMKDCKACLKECPSKDYLMGDSLLGNGRWIIKPTHYHRIQDYEGFPDFHHFPCDYVFTIRRYNGSGINSFHYLMRVLAHLLELRPTYR